MALHNRRKYTKRSKFESTHPDQLTFGSPIYLSALVTRAKQVEGVENVTVTRLRRRGRGDQGELDAGRVQLLEDPPHIRCVK